MTVVKVAVVTVVTVAVRLRIRERIEARKAGSNSDIVKVGVDTY